MIEIKIDEEEAKEIYLERVEKKIKEIEHRFTFWDMKELIRQTKMSDTFIRETFFHDPRFPKYRVGKKWLFPAKEAEAFLIQWLKEQPTN